MGSRPQLPPPLRFTFPKIFSLCRLTHAFFIRLPLLLAQMNPESRPTAVIAFLFLPRAVSWYDRVNDAAPSGDFLYLFTYSLLSLAQACGYRWRVAWARQPRQCDAGTLPVLVMPPLCGSRWSVPRHGPAIGGNCRASPNRDSLRAPLRSSPPIPCEILARLAGLQ